MSTEMLSDSSSSSFLQPQTDGDHSFKPTDGQMLLSTSQSAAHSRAFHSRALHCCLQEHILQPFQDLLAGIQQSSSDETDVSSAEKNDHSDCIRRTKIIHLLQNAIHSASNIMQVSRVVASTPAEANPIDTNEEKGKEANSRCENESQSLPQQLQHQELHDTSIAQQMEVKRPKRRLNSSLSSSSLSSASPSTLSLPSSASSRHHRPFHELYHSSPPPPCASLVSSSASRKKPRQEASAITSSPASSATKASSSSTTTTTTMRRRSRYSTPKQNEAKLNTTSHHINSLQPSSSPPLAYDLLPPYTLPTISSSFSALTSSSGSSSSSSSAVQAYPVPIVYFDSSSLLTESSTSLSLSSSVAASSTLSSFATAAPSSSTSSSTSSSSSSSSPTRSSSSSSPPLPFFCMSKKVSTAFQESSNGAGIVLVKFPQECPSIDLDSHGFRAFMEKVRQCGVAREEKPMVYALSSSLHSSEYTEVDSDCLDDFMTELLGPAAAAAAAQPQTSESQQSQRDCSATISSEAFHSLFHCHPHLNHDAYVHDVPAGHYEDDDKKNANGDKNKTANNVEAKKIDREKNKCSEDKKIKHKKIKGKKSGEKYKHGGEKNKHDGKKRNEYNGQHAKSSLGKSIRVDLDTATMNPELQQSLQWSTLINDRRNLSTRLHRAAAAAAGGGGGGGGISENEEDAVSFDAVDFPLAYFKRATFEVPKENNNNNNNNNHKKRKRDDDDPFPLKLKSCNYFYAHFDQLLKPSVHINYRVLKKGKILPTEQTWYSIAPIHLPLFVQKLPAILADPRMHCSWMQKQSSSRSSSTPYSAASSAASSTSTTSSSPASSSPSSTTASSSVPAMTLQIAFGILLTRRLWFPPEVLRDHGIPFNVTRIGPGEAILISSGTLHWGHVSSECSFGAAINFATRENWLINGIVGLAQLDVYFGFIRQMAALQKQGQLNDNFGPWSHFFGRRYHQKKKTAGIAKALTFVPMAYTCALLRTLARDEEEKQRATSGRVTAGAAAVEGVGGSDKGDGIGGGGAAVLKIIHETLHQLHQSVVRKFYAKYAKGETDEVMLCDCAKNYCPCQACCRASAVRASDHVSPP